MSNLFGRRIAIVSYRLGMADGVSVTAGQWVRALRRLGIRVRTVAGDGRPDVLVRSLALDSPRPPTRGRARPRRWTTSTWWWWTTSARCR